MHNNIVLSKLHNDKIWQCNIIVILSNTVQRRETVSLLTSDMGKKQTWKSRTPWTPQSLTLGDSISKQGKKGQCQKITFLWRNMKEYRILLCFLPFLASVWFLGQFWNFFSKFSKKDHFQKINIEKLYLLFNLEPLDLTKNNKCFR